MNIIRRLTTFTFAACLSLLAISTLPVSAQDAPPKAPVHEVTDTYFGTKIVDPYRWMEDLSSPEVVAWMKAQNDYTHRYLDRLPMRGELLKRIGKLSSANATVSSVQRVGPRYFYFKVAPGEDSLKLYVRDGLNGAERLLLDPEKLPDPGKHYSIMSFTPSDDGKYVAYRLSEGGSEMGDRRVIETATGRDLGERIDRARFGSVVWLPDGRSFLYNRLQKLAPDAPANQLYDKNRVYLHVLGTDPEKDKLIFGYEANPDINVDPKLLARVYAVPGSKYVFAYLNSGVTQNSAFYIAPLASLGQSPVPWRKIADFADEVSAVDLHGDNLYAVTFKQTPRFKVVRTSLTNPDLAKAETVIPASEAVVTGIAAASDALYVQTLDGGIGRLWRVDFKGGTPQQITLPYDGAISISTYDESTPGIFFTLNSWTKSPTIYAYDPAKKMVTDTKLQPPSPADFSAIESIEVKARSYDGTMIPLSIIYKRGLKRDGSNPTLLDGYGSYGISYDPVFIESSLAWLERGGVMAIAHVRGGGEYGQEWHLAGYKQTKPNTWKDFIACAEYLIREKYTSPAHLAGEGLSAGGILISNAIAERPDLFGAAIIRIGATNALRFETTPVGVLNIPEFGSVTTEEGFKGLLAMDAYHKIKNGTAYPAVMLTTGFNDSRVAAWMLGKMAARLQAATTSGKPVLLRVDFNAGHDTGGATQQQLNEEDADRYTFLFEHLATARTKNVASHR